MGLERHIAILTTIRWAGVLAGFIVNVLLARVLEPAEIGAASVALAVSTMVALTANGGLNIASIYFLGQRPDRRHDIAHTSTILAGLACFAAAAIAMGVGEVALRTTSVSDKALVIASAAMASGLIGYEVSGALLLGLGQRRAYLVNQVIEGLGSLFWVAAALLLVSRSASSYVASVGLAYWAAAVPSLVMAYRVVAAGAVKPRWDAQYARQALTMGWRGQIGNVFQYLNLRLDQVLVAALTDLASAGVYLMSTRVAEAITQVGSASGTFLFPEVARARDRDTSVTERTTRGALIVVTALAAVLALMSEPFLGLVFGPEFARGAWALRILMVAMLPLTMVRLLASDLKGRGRAGLVSVSTAIGLGATVVLDLALVPPLGIVGAAVASLVAYTVTAVALSLGFQRVTGQSALALIPRPSDAAVLARQATCGLGARLVGRGRAR